MEAATLNPTQRHLLRLFSYNKDEHSLTVLKDALLNYYFKEMNKEAEQWWIENNMTAEKFDKLFNE